MTSKNPKKSSCCAPARPAGSAGNPRVQQPVTHGPETRTYGAVHIPGGTGLVGTKTALMADDGESPIRSSRIKPFLISATTVTNAQFAEFVEQTGYVTEAETFGWSFVFWSQVPAHFKTTQGVAGVEWWRKVDGANWRNVGGPGSDATAWNPDHPVVQVSWNDARAYADWVGGALPNEAQWEHAARGGQTDVKYPWGNTEPDDDTTLPCNIWQGKFPDRNTAADGYAATAPAHSFEPNAYGLYNMVGNVWEWTQDPFRVKSLKKSVRQRLAGMPGYKLLKGGSFLCHRSYCYRYRIAARSGNSPDSTTTHQGFRVVWPANAGAPSRA